MNFVAFDPFIHLEYARSVLNVPISTNTGGIVAIDSEPCGIVLLDNWTPTSVSGHIAVQNPMALRELHKEVFNYVFKDCDRLMFIGIAPANNRKALRLNKHFGFTEIARIKNGHDFDVDTVILQMLREDCQYITQLKEVA